MTTLEKDHQVIRYINRLPDELLLYIFQYLPSEAILSCENVCKRWNKLARDPAVWRHIQLIYDGQKLQQNRKTMLNVINSHCEQIQCLRIKHVHDYTIIKSMVEICKNLISLDLYYCTVSKEFEDDILKFPNLRKLNVLETVIGPGRPDIVVQFDKLKDLNYLALSFWGINTKNCYSILQCTHLSHIFLDKVEEWDLDFIKLLILSRKGTLKSFHVHGGSSVDDSVLQLLSQCPELEYLSILDCETLSDRSLLSLSSSKTLKHLKLKNNSNFSEIGLQKTFTRTSLLSLECLILKFIQNITPTVVDLISEHRHLKYLYLNKSCYIDVDYENQFESKYGQDLIT